MRIKSWFLLVCFIIVQLFSTTALADSTQQAEEMIFSDGQFYDAYIIKYKEQNVIATFADALLGESMEQSVQSAFEFTVEAMEPQGISDAEDLQMQDYSINQIQNETESGDDAVAAPVVESWKDGYSVVQLGEQVDPDIFMQQLTSSRDDIAYIQPDYRLDLADVLTNDETPSSSEEALPTEELPLITEEPAFTNGPEETAPPEPLDLSNILYDRNADMQASWITATGTGVKVAVIDSGVDITHPDLSDKIQNAWDITTGQALTYNADKLYDFQHGTHVAGIIAASAPGAAVMPVKVFENGQARTSDLIDAIEYAEQNGASIVNCSWGSTGENPALREAMEASAMTFVCAAGNNRLDLDVTPIYPACFNLPNTVSVTALNEDLGLSYFSNYSPEHVDVAAWGRDIESTWPGGGYMEMTGTSMAAAFVTAGAAMVQELEATDIKGQLKATADKLSNLESTVDAGNKISYYRLVNNLTEDGYAEVNPADDFDVHGYQRTPSENMELFCSLDTVQVAEGNGFTLALKNNGTVWGWGNNTSYQLGDGTSKNNGTPVQAVGVTDIVKIGAGYMHSVALKNDGTVWVWGTSSTGALTGNGVKRYMVPTKIAGVSDVVDIWVRYNCVVIKKSNGTVWAWGENYGNRFGIDDNYLYSPLQIQDLFDIKDIGIGNKFLIAIKNDGTALACGYNSNGQLGTRDYANVDSYTQIPSVNGAVAIAAGSDHSYILKGDGNVYSSGYNSNGQLGIPKSIPKRNSFELVQGFDEPVVQICAFGNNGLFRTEQGSLYGVGRNYEGQLGDGTNVDRIQVWKNENIPPISFIETAYNTSFAIDMEGIMYGWGDNLYCQTGDGSRAYRETPYMINLYNAISISTASSHSAAVKNDGTVWTWGSSNGIFKNQTDTGGIPQKVPNFSGAKEIYAGDGGFTLALKQDGTVWAWGYNGLGQLGNGTTTNTSTPVQVKDPSGTGYLNGIQHISGGKNCSFAIKSDGTVFGWGYNDTNQLGIDNIVKTTLPVEIPNLTNIDKIVGGNDYGLALKNDGTVWAWGNNTKGQLGLGDTTIRETPVQISSLTNVIDISAGTSLSIAAKEDGTVYTWGDNSGKALGNVTNTSSYQPSPVQVSNTTNIVRVEAGSSYCLCLNSNGLVTAWGVNTYGQGGNSDGSKRTIYNNASDISAGYVHNMLISSGAVMTWGDSHNGRLGDSFSNYVRTPIMVFGDVNDAEGNSKNDAHRIVANHTITAHTTTATDEDWYEFQPKYNGTYTLNVNGANFWMILPDGTTTFNSSIEMVYPNRYKIAVVKREYVQTTYSIRINSIANKTNTKAYETTVGSDIYYSNLSDGGKLYKGTQAVAAASNYPVKWLCSSGNTLYYSTNNAIYKFDGTAETKLVDNVKAYYLVTDGSYIYFSNWSDSGYLYKCSVNGVQDTLSRICKCTGTWLEIKSDGKLYFNYSQKKGARYSIQVSQANQLSNQTEYEPEEVGGDLNVQ